MAADRLAVDGFVVVDGAVDGALGARLCEVFAALPHQRAGSRAGLDHPAVRELAASLGVRALVEPALGARAFAVRATLFDKNPRANWHVAWHQDLVVPVRERREVPGFSAWSQKEGVTFAQPPAQVLEGMLAVRVDLDGSHAANGALRVLPGTHTLGILSAGQRFESSWSREPVTCAVPAGGALAMRPLLLHASSRAGTPSRRRVVHLEFAAHELPAGLEWHERVC
ncbi:MAG TPA: phytanoyl-CoA dioxygenase family protein [Planctomycetota bacterium]|nr:phytanoyl-CoA dioxygenase family protein [Planctomycetota bacterium]